MVARVRSVWRAPLILLALGCSPARRATTSPLPGPGEPGACSVVEHVEVPLDLLGEAPDPPSVVRWGERFALLGSGSLSQRRTADSAVVSWDGVDVEEHLALTALCPDDVCTNVLGVAVLATAAGRPQLLLVDEGSAVSMPAYPLRARAWDSARSEPLGGRVFDARIAAVTTRVAMKGSRDGARALFVLGNIDAAELQAIEMGVDAAVVAPVSTMDLAAARWDCLTVVPTHEAGAISAVTRTDSGTEVVWHLRELDAEASTVLDRSVTVPVGDALGYTGCPTVVESAQGYAAQWVNTDAQSVVAKVLRATSPGTTPELLRLDRSPGVLAGGVGTELLFQGQVDDEHQGFARLAADGASGGPPITLPPLPASTLEHRRAPPSVLSVEGSSLYLTYELEAARVFEELSCL
jgi:hypothetical protein